MHLVGDAHQPLHAVSLYTEKHQLVDQGRLVGDRGGTWEGSGDFLHGAVDLPSWLALGLDFRYAGLSNDVGNSTGAKRVHFPMQLDAHARAAMGGSFSLAVTGGFRGQLRPNTGGLGSDNFQPAQSSTVISREHYVMWRPAAIGAYVRAGRFFVPYGLRMAEHALYVRRDTGLNLLEESYGVSGGIVKNEWELHVTAFGPDFVRKMGNRDSGGAAMFEKKLGDASAVGLGTRIGFSEDAARFGGGAFGKTYFEAAKLLLMAEGNLIQLRPKNVSEAVTTVGSVSYLGATFFPFRGFWASVFGERWQTSIKVKDSATNAYGVQLNWFPYPHFELTILGRMQAPAGIEKPTQTVLLMGHYYL
jgi:hypothetical protein